MSLRKYIVFLVIVITFLSACSPEAGNVANQNTEDVISQNLVEETLEKPFNSLELGKKHLSDDEYSNWVVNSYEGYYDTEKYKYKIPSINEFVYPYVINMEDEDLQESINQQIVESIFSDKIISRPMGSIQVSNTPWSLFENPGHIIINNVLSIPIVVYWNEEKANYKAYSITIDLETGERLYLNDIIEVDKEFASAIIYQQDFYEDIEMAGEIHLSDYLNNYYDVDKKLKNDVIQHVLSDLVNDDSDKIEEFYLTETALVLTHYANSGVPWEINIPKENLHEFIKLDLWE